MGQPEKAQGKPKMTRDQDFLTVASKRNHNPAYCKVPGSLTAVGKMSHELSALKSQMKNKTVVELQEMLNRQQKLVENSALLRKLPDKGAKAVDKLGVLKELVEEKNEELMLSRAMARLNLPDTEALEWGDGGKPGAQFNKNQETEETLRVLAERELPSRATEKEDVDNYQTNKVSNLDHFKSPARFAPFSCAKSKDASTHLASPPAHAITKRISPVVKTPCIPLPQVYECATKQLSLQESMEVQKEYVARHREASLRQAAARLSSFNKPKPEFNQTVDIKISDLNWREPVHVDEGEFEEEHGDEDEEEGGGVNVIAFEDGEE